VLCTGTRSSYDQANWLHGIESQLLRKIRPNLAFSEKKGQQNSKCVSGPQEKQSQRGHRTVVQHERYQAHTYPLSSEQKTGRFETCGTPAPEYNATSHLFLVTFIFFCCWIPYLIVSIQQASTMVSGRGTLRPQMHTMSAWLALLNSAINHFYTLF
jgi:hypothetical protein